MTHTDIVQAQSEALHELKGSLHILLFLDLDLGGGPVIKGVKGRDGSVFVHICYHTYTHPPFLAHAFIAKPSSSPCNHGY